MKTVVSKKIIQVKNNKIQFLEDFFAAEVKIKIIINNKDLHIKELLTGFLLTKNIK